MKRGLQTGRAATMATSQRLLLTAIVLVLSAGGCTSPPRGPGARPDAAGTLLALDAPSPTALAELWDVTRRPLPPAPLVTPEMVTAEVRRLRKEAPDLIGLEQIGQSVEGRPLWHLSTGRGPLRVLLWSQMHGDEPSATPALFDLLETIRLHASAPRIARLLGRLTLDVVPMLNPDGAHRFQRRNAQGIDINRDALRLQTPEGQALKALRDRLSPAIGFNLHNQNWRTSVGRPPRPATMSLLSVAFDEATTVSPGRVLTKRVCAVIRDAVDPLAPGQVGRYDDSYEERAFGDNVTKWGTPVVLIETGAWPGDQPDEALTRLNYVALVTALDALASGRVRSAAVDRYDTLPMNGDRLFHTLVRNATLVPGTGVAPFVADIGIVAQRTVRVVNGERRMGLSARIDDLGDLRVHGALEVIDATGLVVAPLVDGSATSAGSTVHLDERAVLPVRVGIGEPAALLLLRRTATPGAYTVERVLRIGEAAAAPGPR
jgi:hypothetical protein